MVSGGRGCWFGRSAPSDDFSFLVFLSLCSTKRKVRPFLLIQHLHIHADTCDRCISAHACRHVYQRMHTDTCIILTHAYWHMYADRYVSTHVYWHMQHVYQQMHADACISIHMHAKCARCILSQPLSPSPSCSRVAAEFFEANKVRMGTLVFGEMVRFFPFFSSRLESTPIAMATVTP